MSFQKILFLGLTFFQIVDDFTERYFRAELTFYRFYMSFRKILFPETYFS